MSCYNPISAFVVGINKDTGKKIISFSKDPAIKDLRAFEAIQIPCGKCIGCRLDYSRTWADRCMLENQYHKNSWFLTLTYDDDHLPPKKEGSPIHSLRKEDFQNFIKSLRQKMFDDYVSSNEYAKLYYSKKKGSNWKSEFKNDYPEEYKEFIENVPKLRYFGCGEYGSMSKSCRPHLHILLYGVPITDAKTHRVDRNTGYIYYTSDYIADIWNYGFHLLTKVTWETCAYTARYVVKKQKGENSKIYEELNYEPEFVLMSRKPGIGAKWFLDHPDIVTTPHYIGTSKGSKKIMSNKYFDTLFENMFDDNIEEIKLERKRSQSIKTELKMSLTSQSYSDMLRSEEINKEAAIKSLKRKEV